MAFKYDNDLLILGSIARIVRDNDGKFNSDTTITVCRGGVEEDDLCFYEDEDKRAVGLSSYVSGPSLLAGTPMTRRLGLRFYELNADGFLQLQGDIDEAAYVKHHTQYTINYELPAVYEATGLKGPSLDYVFEYKAASLAILNWLRKGQVIPAEEYEAMAPTAQRARLLEMLNKY
jgi:hypothetical protein